MNYIKINGLKRNGEHVTIIKATTRKRITSKLTKDIRQEMLSMIKELGYTNDMYDQIEYLDIEISIVELMQDNNDHKVFKTSVGQIEIKVDKNRIIQLSNI